MADVSQCRAVLECVFADYDTELNFLVCSSSTSGYYDLFLQTGADTPSGKSCSNYQTLHLPCLC